MYMYKQNTRAIHLTGSMSILTAIHKLKKKTSFNSTCTCTSF